MKELIVHQINVAHYRLLELVTLANNAKPFYDWVERKAKMITGSHKSLHEILLTVNKNELKEIIEVCYYDKDDEKPFLFDGIGRVYKHTKACFYFFAWIIRDAPQQRLTPLITRMKKVDNVNNLTAEIDTLVSLIDEYKHLVKNFEWATIREIIIDRLEGSRRSISGHHLEGKVRASLLIAIQHFFSIYNNYGIYKKVEIAAKQIKLGKHTVDISAKLFPKNGNPPTYLLIPVKTRETEGGGHSHLFSRDILNAITEIKKSETMCHIAVVIIAENWSPSEVETIKDEIDKIFHFNAPPNTFMGFDENSQIIFNKYIETILKGKQ